MTIKVEDTYEAAFYMMNGAVVTDFSYRKIPKNRRLKKTTYKLQWVMMMEGVQLDDVEAWKLHIAVVNVRAYKEQRLKLKMKIRKIQER